MSKRRNRRKSVIQLETDNLKKIKSRKRDFVTDTIRSYDNVSPLIENLFHFDNHKIHKSLFAGLMSICIIVLVACIAIRSFYAIFILR